MKLISMTDFVLEQDLKTPIGRTAGQMVKYGLFLKQKLELWMFVPCKLVDGVWVVLEEPRKHFGKDYTPREETHTYFVEFQEAKDRVLFEGFEYCQQNVSYSHSFTLNKSCLFVVEFLSGTVEDYAHYNLELTTTAQKLIGL